MVAGLGGPGVLVGVRAIGGKRYAVTSHEIVNLAVEMEPQRTAEHYDELMRSRGVRLGGVRAPRREAQLVELDQGGRARGGERPALELSVERAQHLRIPTAKHARAALHLPDQVGERHPEADRDLPEQPDGRVRLHGLHLGKRGAAHARCPGKVVE